MKPGELEKHTTNEDLLGGILATLNRVELLLSQQNQPRPSGLSEDSARDSGDAERHSDREDDKNEGQSGNEQEGEGGVNEEDQEDGKEADDANQADENEAENENQQHDDEAEEWTSCGRKGDVESVAEPAMSNIANMPEFGEVIGFGDRIPHNPTYPLLFSQAFLEGFEPDEVKRRIGVIAEYLETVSQLDGLVKLDIIDFPIVDELYNTRSGTILKFIDLHPKYEGQKCPIQYSMAWFWVNESTKYHRILCLEGASEVAKKIKSTFAHEICPLIFSRPNIWSYHLIDAVDLHIECAERRRSIKRVVVLGGYIFHTTFFQLCQSHTESDSWSTGRLYSIGDFGGKLFRKACITLFSASGVMESRQSRILGENVQLLAFVTIFFLPLAFSASLWSIPGVNEKYPGIMIPGAFAAIIGFITYFIVFNLNLLISGLRRLFSVPRSILLTRMANEKYHPKYDSEDGSEDDPQGDPEGSSDTTSARSSVNDSTNARNSVSTSMREVGSVNNSIHEGRSVNNSINGGSSVSNSIRERRSVNNSINEGNSVNNSTNEGRSVNNSTRESSSGNILKSDGSVKKKVFVINDKLPTDWPKRAKAFEVFPRQDEGPRPSNWLLLFYAIRLLVLKAFDLVIGFLAWLREVIASDPSNQDPDTEMANRPTARRK